MRVLIFHGYLLGGTGSNVYNANLVGALVRLGHEVHLLSQDRHAGELPFVDAVGDWDGGELCVEVTREPVRCTVYRPDIGSLLPVYVKDRYEGIEARTFADCSDAEVERYIELNVAAVRELAERVEPDLALANHLVMGPVILARALAGRDVPYAVKIHGSALEYTVKPQPDRFLGLAREGLASATGILVGSHHTASSLWAALDDPSVQRRTRLGPPGVDVERFRPPESAQAAWARVDHLVGRLRHDDSAAREDAFSRDAREAADALELLLAGNERTLGQSDFGGAVLAGDPDAPLVAYVGKLIVSKGVDLLIGAWPLVLERIPDARLVVVGFGAFRAGLERVLRALAEGDLEQAIALADAGRALETDPDGPGGTSEQETPLRHLRAFLVGLEGEDRARYLRAATMLPRQIVFAGRLDHEELVELLPVCEALVVPSTFPEAFGMVAAEAASCGVLPISADHSGLAEVSAALARTVPAEASVWLSFPIDDRSVSALAERILGWLGAGEPLRSQTRSALERTVRERWSWDSVAEGVIAAAQGELDGLPEP